MEQPTTNRLVELISDYSTGYVTTFTSKNKLLSYIQKHNTLLIYIRKHVFVANQKLFVIRKWFDLLYHIPLTDKELEIMKKIVIKPNSTNWDILSTIIKEQKNMSGEKIKEWFDSIKSLSTGDRAYIFFYVIRLKKIEDEELKTKLFKDLLYDFVFQKDALMFIDGELTSPLISNSLCEKLFNSLVEVIQEGGEISEKLLFYWVNLETIFDKYAKEKEIRSMLLYNKTGLDQYLPQDVQDIFLF